MDGKEFPGPINADIVKKYYAWGNKGSEKSSWKPEKAALVSKSEKKKKQKRKKKRFKVKIRKGNLNHKKNKKKEKKVEVKLKTRKGRLDYKVGYLDWKPEKGDLTIKWDTWIENQKGQSRRMEIWSKASKE